MRRTLLAVLFSIIAVGLIATAHAGSFSEDFESYSGTDGDALGTVASSTWTDDAAGIKWSASAPDIAGGGNTNKAARHPASSGGHHRTTSVGSFTTDGLTQFTVSAMFRAAGTVDGSLDAFVAVGPPALGNSDDTSFLFGFNDGNLRAYVPNSGCCRLDAVLGGGIVDPDKWLEVEVTYNVIAGGSNDTITARYRNATDSGAWIDMVGHSSGGLESSHADGNITGGAEEIDTAGPNAVLLQTRANHDIFIDNIQVTIPEPTSFALAGLGLLGVAVCGSRRQRRR